MASIMLVSFPFNLKPMNVINLIQGVRMHVIMHINTYVMVSLLGKVQTPPLNLSQIKFNVSVLFHIYSGCSFMFYVKTCTPSETQL